VEDESQRKESGKGQNLTIGKKSKQIAVKRPPIQMPRRAVQESTIRFLDDPLESNYGVGGLTYEDPTGQSQTDTVVLEVPALLLEAQPVQHATAATRNDVGDRNQDQTAPKPRVTSAALKRKRTVKEQPVSSCCRLTITALLTRSWQINLLSMTDHRTNAHSLKRKATTAAIVVDVDNQDVVEVKPEQHSQTGNLSIGAPQKPHKEGPSKRRKLAPASTQPDIQGLSTGVEHVPKIKEELEVDVTSASNTIHERLAVPGTTLSPVTTYGLSRVRYRQPQTMEDEDDGPAYVCSLCNGKYASLYGIQVHARTKHAGRSVTLNCRTKACSHTCKITALPLSETDREMHVLIQYDYNDECRDDQGKKCSRALNVLF